MDEMIEVKIKACLESFQRAVSSGDGETVSSSLQELDQLVAEHGRDLNPQLAHFLQRRSYDKALAFLGGEDDIPAGICGGKA